MYIDVKSEVSELFEIFVFGVYTMSESDVCVCGEREQRERIIYG